MGGGIARHEVAAAVSEAGGLGTIGFLSADRLAKELSAARGLTGAAIAVNLLLPFARRTHREVASEADAVTTFWGTPRRPGPRPWLHQCGSVAEAVAAHEAGADGVIAQGVEAGGHVRGEIPALELLQRVRAALPDGYPVLLAGGLADREDLLSALEAGADAGVFGTRFLLSEESRAHPEYKLRLLGAESTILTELFGLGWPSAPHRVLPNAATGRWAATDPRGAPWLRAANRVLSPLASRLPPAIDSHLIRRQSPRAPLLSPRPATDDGPDSLVDAGPLYAGETVMRLAESRPAGELVRDLLP
jgi:nitronate monooxygenase